MNNALDSLHRIGTYPKRLLALKNSMSLVTAFSPKCFRTIDGLATLRTEKSGVLSVWIRIRVFDPDEPGGAQYGLEIDPLGIREEPAISPGASPTPELPKMEIRHR